MSLDSSLSSTQLYSVYIMNVARVLTSRWPPSRGCLSRWRAGRMAGAGMDIIIIIIITLISLSLSPYYTIINFTLYLGDSSPSLQSSSSLRQLRARPVPPGTHKLWTEFGSFLLSCLLILSSYFVFLLFAPLKCQKTWPKMA